MTVDRRRFLQLSAASAASLAWRSSSARAQGPSDLVVIIGAGLAGLRSADLLKKSGRSVFVLEARADPGGRVATVRGSFDEDLYGDAGPVRIAGSHQAVLSLA